MVLVRPRYGSSSYARPRGNRVRRSRDDAGRPTPQTSSPRRRRYQGFLAGDRGWRTFELPFTSFVATRGGKMLGQPRILDVARFASLSIAIADDVEGPFRLEIRGVEALREGGDVEVT